MLTSVELLKHISVLDLERHGAVIMLETGLYLELLSHVVNLLIVHENDDSELVFWLRRHSICSIEIFC